MRTRFRSRNRPQRVVLVVVDPVVVGVVILGIGSESSHRGCRGRLRPCPRPSLTSSLSVSDRSGHRQVRSCVSLGRPFGVARPSFMPSRPLSARWVSVAPFQLEAVAHTSPSRSRLPALATWAPRWLPPRVATTAARRLEHLHSLHGLNDGQRIAVDAHPLVGATANDGPSPRIAPTALEGAQPLSRAVWSIEARRCGFPAAPCSSARRFLLASFTCATWV